MNYTKVPTDEFKTRLQPTPSPQILAKAAELYRAAGRNYAAQLLKSNIVALPAICVELAYEMYVNLLFKTFFFFFFFGFTFFLFEYCSKIENCFHLS